MTTSSASGAHLLIARRTRRGVRADLLLAALLATGVAGFLGLGALAEPAPPSSGAAGAARVALIVDAGPRPRATLRRAGAAASGAEHSGSAEVAVRVPRTAAEAASDVRYFAAQRYAAVVVAGPLARAAARAAAPDFPRTRFEGRARLLAAFRSGP
jgi:hypothetical protein